MIIQHNIAAINSYRNLGINQGNLNKNLEKLSSGYRINRAGDDAAGLAISEAMRSQINGLNQSAKNAQDAVGLIQTAEGALTEVHSMLQRMTTLASQAANGTYNTVARGNLQSELDQLLKEIDRIANYTDFNGIKPIASTVQSPKLQVNGMTTPSIYVNISGKDDGLDVNQAKNTQSALQAGKMTFQIGPSRFETIEVATQIMTSSGIGVAQLGSSAYSSNNMSTNNGEGMLIDQKSANSAITIINTAIDIVSTYRSKLGAAQNRLEHTINNLKVTSENITAAESRIRDTDMADEITSFTKNNILLQASQSMLAQSNSVPQSILQLL